MEAGPLGRIETVRDLTVAPSAYDSGFYNVSDSNGTEQVYRECFSDGLANPATAPGMKLDRKHSFPVQPS